MRRTTARRVRIGPIDYLNTQAVSAILCCTSQRVRREIWAGRLPCRRRVQQSRRVSYWVALDDLRAYVETYDRACSARLPAA